MLFYQIIDISEIRNQRLSWVDDELVERISKLLKEEKHTYFKMCIIKQKYEDGLLSKFRYQKIDWWGRYLNHVQHELLDILMDNYIKF